MSYKTVTVKGRRFVLVPEEEYNGLAEKELPRFPEPNAKGHYPARETMAVSMARGIIRRRRALGWSQAELAKRAGMRVETINRIELAKHSPSIRTVDKIDKALNSGEKKRQSVRSVDGRGPASACWSRRPNTSC